MHVFLQKNIHAIILLLDNIDWKAVGMNISNEKKKKFTGGDL